MVGSWGSAKWFAPFSRSRLTGESCRYGRLTLFYQVESNRPSENARQYTDGMELDPQYLVRDTAELRALYGQPRERSLRKQMDHLDEYSRAFIAASPFVILSTQGAGSIGDPDGLADCSPRGDAPGFVKVVDDRTLLLPDRRGNNRLDGLLNVLVNPRIGLLFLIPGINESFRVNGIAQISRDPALTAQFVVQEKTPNTVLVIHVQEAYVHCSRALLRASLWDPAKFARPGAVPSFGTIMAAHTRGLVDAQTVDEEYRTRMPALY